MQTVGHANATDEVQHPPPNPHPPASQQKKKWDAKWASESWLLFLFSFCFCWNDEMPVDRSLARWLVVGVFKTAIVQLVVALQIE